MTGPGKTFSDIYGNMRLPPAAHEGAGIISEHLLQRIWHEGLYRADDLRLEDGRALRVVSPGWWNHGEGPDFTGAQLEMDGWLRGGDVEIHLDPGGWRGHGHHLDARYDDVILHVVLEPGSVCETPATSEGRVLPTLCLRAYLSDDLPALAAALDAEDGMDGAHSPPGKCAALTAWDNDEGLVRFLRVAGEWRMLAKSRALRERMDLTGPAQAVYEYFAVACGHGPYKQHFRAIARHLPYERARQLALLDPLALEAALLQIAGLLPEHVDGEGPAAQHFTRLAALREKHLCGLRRLPLAWRERATRPVNGPERRLAGLGRVVVRTAKEGLLEALDSIWREDLSPLARRRAFEALFPRAMGFWSSHCCWTGKTLTRPAALLGAGRMRSIIGNVFVPAALAFARAARDRAGEEAVFAFFQALPKEGDNRIVQVMLPRLLGKGQELKLDFCLQQGLLQVYQDWCQPNPSCRNCALLSHLQRLLPVTR